MDHDQMMRHDGMGAMAQEQATGATQGQGVINSVDAKGGSVNITHEPIPALSWPAMTMDLPVTDAVDLSGVSAGDKVDFAIMLGSDNVYRITALKRLD
ncbi:copper-binding protein [Thiorhodococcus mannitoliphagus]|uniref:Copper-binding protein n=2 Tax=Thiorhodococcus mannitoliphagus TaxID=329406 RepID=A0A6P1DS10_9GAMM|nr:copper-binding protein [Thiorhodococcus mannitoliphagus]